MDLSVNLGPVISNNDYILTHFSDKKQYLNIGHMNVQSLNPAHRSTKFDEFTNLLAGSILDVVGVTGTWLKSGYKLFRVDRCDDIMAGGVALYIREGMDAKLFLNYLTRNQLSVYFWR